MRGLPLYTAVFLGGGICVAGPLSKPLDHSSLRVSLRNRDQSLNIQVDLRRKGAVFEGEIGCITQADGRLEKYKRNVPITEAAAEAFIDAVAAAADGFELSPATEPLPAERRGTLDLTIYAGDNTHASFRFAQRDRRQWAAIAKAWNLAIDAVPADAGLQAFRLKAEAQAPDHKEKALRSLRQVALERRMEIERLRLRLQTMEREGADASELQRTRRELELGKRILVELERRIAE